MAQPGSALHWGCRGRWFKSSRSDQYWVGCLLTLLCKLENIPDGNAVGMVAEVAGKKRNIFVVRRGQRVSAYLNWCPHNQVLIDQIPGQFFNHDKTYLQCSKHGALFRIDDGFCVKGPCEGEYLKALDSYILGENILIKD